MPLKNHFLIPIFILLVMTLACVAPALSVMPTATSPILMPVATSVILPTDTSQPTEIPSPMPTSTNALVETPTLALLETTTPISFPTVTFQRNTNCRFGPAKNYSTQTSFLENRMTIAEGRNADSSWLWVQSITPTVRCWVSVTNLKNPETFKFLPVVDFPPLPESPLQILVEKKECEGRNRIILQWSDVK